MSQPASLNDLQAHVLKAVARANEGLYADDWRPIEVIAPLCRADGYPAPANVRSSLNALVRRGLVEVDDPRFDPAYRITAAGRAALKQASGVASQATMNLAASVEVYEAPVTQRPHANTLSAAVATLQQNERLDIAAYIEADALASHEVNETPALEPLALTTPVTITTLGVNGVVVARSTCDGSRYQVAWFCRRFWAVRRVWVGRGVLEVEKKTPANEFASAS